jgi:hypothetical protein
VGKVETGMGETAEGFQRKIFMTFWYVGYFFHLPSSASREAVFHSFILEGRSAFPLLGGDDRGLNHNKEDPPHQ